MERELRRAFLDDDCQYGWSSVAFGPKGAFMVGATHNRLNAGEVVRIDLVGLCRGLMSDISRVAVWGEPSAEAQRAHDAVRRANEAVCHAIRPGARPCDLYDLGVRIMAEANYHLLSPQIGHGVGWASNEPPFLTARNERPLEPGVVLAVEASFRLQAEASPIP